ncbi:MAG: hypothetical protein M1118_12620 [Chloroflexi bacterium]|nr:hypothetical protein [Chloroflexota bacterium]
MGAYQSQTLSGKLVEQVARAVLVTDVQGMFVCPVPGCNAAIGYAVGDVVDHLWTSHRGVVVGSAIALIVLLAAQRRNA